MPTCVWTSECRRVINYKREGPNCMEAGGEGRSTGRDEVRSERKHPGQCSNQHTEASLHKLSHCSHKPNSWPNLSRGWKNPSITGPDLFDSFIFLFLPLSLRAIDLLLLIDNTFRAPHTPFCLAIASSLKICLDQRAAGASLRPNEWVFVRV